MLCTLHVLRVTDIRVCVACDCLWSQSVLFGVACCQMREIFENQAESTTRIVFLEARKLRKLSSVCVTLANIWNRRGNAVFRPPRRPAWLRDTLKEDTLFAGGICFRAALRRRACQCRSRLALRSERGFAPHAEREECRSTPPACGWFAQAACRPTSTEAGAGTRVPTQTAGRRTGSSTRPSTASVRRLSS